MKKTIFRSAAALSLVLALGLAACGKTPSGSGTPPASGSTPATSLSSADAADANTPGANTDLINTLNRLANGYGLAPVDEDPFSGGYTCEVLPAGTLYRTTGHMGVNIILLHNPTAQRWTYVDLEGYASFPIRWVSNSPERDGELVISTTAEVFGGDHTFKSFDCDLTIDASTGKIIKTEYLPASGNYGILTYSSACRFAACGVQGNVATFTFTSQDASGWPPCPEIEIVLPLRFEYEEEAGRTAYFGFKNTQMNLDDAFVAQLNALEGVAKAAFTYQESPFFTGTQLALTAKEGWQVTCFFNQSGIPYTFEDFNITCTPLPA